MAGKQFDFAHAAVSPLSSRIGKCLAQGGEEAGPRLGLRDAARLVDMAGEEEAGQAECVLDRGAVGAQASPRLRNAGSASILSCQRRAGLARHRPARFRRDIDQIVARPVAAHSRQVEAEAELVEHQQLEAHDQLAGRRGIVEMLDDHGQRLVERAVRIALGQQPQMRGNRLQAVDGDARCPSAGRR